MKNLILCNLVLSVLVSISQADELAPLDPPYTNLVHPKVVQLNTISDVTSLFRTQKTSVESVIAQQSAVKSQVERGTCSIFSATAMLEHLLIQQGQFQTDLDLSEEWLQYLISQSTTGEGSYSTKNFEALKQYGQPFEKSYPYIGQSWKDATYGDAQKRCGHLSSYNLQKCLVAHRDPALLHIDEEYLYDINSAYYDMDFFYAKREAAFNRDRFFQPTATYKTLWDTAKIKSLLDAGIPVTLDITFFYGAWAHRVSEELGIFRDMNQWAQGLVTFPESGSMDASKSGSKAAGHSVLVVGYDDSRVVEYTMNMTDGTKKTFQRKGVYYFKNSWGSSNFGTQTTIGNQIYPGYGMITQDYANQYGSFFSFSLK